MRPGRTGRAESTGRRERRAAPWLRALRRAWIALHPRSFAARARPDDVELGLLGERLVELDLRRRGWRIVGRRVRSACAEIDLVARDGEVLVLVEVKSARVEPLPRRAGAPPNEITPRWRPAERWHPASRARLTELARSLGRGRGRVRLDLVEVYVDAASGRVRLEHHQGAASASPLP